MYIIRNRDETWDVSADELAALHLAAGDSLSADELREALRSAAIPTDLRGWLAAMAQAAPEQVVYVEAGGRDGAAAGGASGVTDQP